MIEQQESALDKELHRLHEAYSTIHILRSTVQQGYYDQRGDVPQRMAARRCAQNSIRWTGVCGIPIR